MKSATTTQATPRTFEARDVLAGAYRGQSVDLRTLLVHLVEVTASGEADKTLCNRVKKICACCKREYDALSWASLTYVGIQHVEADEIGPDESFEYRNCPCGSTLVINVNDS